MHPSSLQPQIDRILALIERGDIRRAGPAAEQLVARHPEHAPARGAFSELWLRCGRADLACEQAEEAVRLAPDSAPQLAQLAKCLVFAARYRRALSVAEAALSLEPEDHATVDTLGNVFSRLGEHERALDLFRRALSLAPANTTAMYNLATSLRFFGHNDEAGKLIDRVIETDPGDFHAIHSRSLLRRQSESANHVQELRDRLRAGPPWPAGSHIGYALGKELDDLGRAKEAFAAYREAAESMHRNLPDTLPADLDNIEAAIASLPALKRSSAPSRGHDAPEPIFVFGLPRTGSTLIERVLAAHPDVFAAGELHNFRFEAQRALQAGSAAEALAKFSENPARLDAARLGEAYIASTRPRTGSKARFVDKMPRNDLWAALIHLSLPGAKMILTRRHPMDTGYALFRTLFHTGYHFSYDLERIGHYLVAHRRLSDALIAALPGPELLTIDYEELVRAPEKGTRRLLSHCGLDWREDVLDFHHGEGAVATASSHQVRRPFHTDSIGKWRAVADQLEPLRRVLAEAGIDPDD
jgi:tetratricopeptide (TPR) repeat protein